jgi:hypothetical protein
MLVGSLFGGLITQNDRRPGRALGARVVSFDDA